jgi:hypothetical protein
MQYSPHVQQQKKAMKTERKESQYSMQQANTTKQVSKACVCYLLLPSVKML